MSPRAAIPRFLALHEAILSTLGQRVPTILVPGNHDRRRWGLMGPQRDELFDELKSAVDPSEIFVAGCATPFLAQLVPAGFHRLPAHVIAYDSTFLPTGLLSAGGMIRQEDLLQVMAPLSAEEPPLPLVLLMHHHLIPTPVTDMSQIDSRAMPWLGRWLVSRALPWLVSNADREEMTMTALGAGTALSTLHALRRPTLVLHGTSIFPPRGSCMAFRRTRAMSSSLLLEAAAVASGSMRAAARNRRGFGHRTISSSSITAR